MDFRNNWLTHFRRIVDQEIKDAGGDVVGGRTAVALKLEKNEQTIYQHYTQKSGKVFPTVEMMAMLEKKYGAGRLAGWSALPIESAASEASHEANVEPRAPTVGSVPLISWIRAGDFCESPATFEPGDAEEYLPRPLQNMGKNVFALTVRGESMDTADGYKEGEIVYIDPDKVPVSGQDVVARVENKLNLKRYKEDQDGPYLLQLNGNIIIRPEGEWSVCGVVVFSGKRR